MIIIILILIIRTIIIIIITIIIIIIIIIREPNKSYAIAPYQYRRHPYVLLPMIIIIIRRRIRNLSHGKLGVPAFNEFKIRGKKPCCYRVLDFIF